MISLAILCILISMCSSNEDDFLVISVKTTKANHKTRVQDIIDTWFQDLSDQIYFFSDSNDADLNRKVNGHLFNTGCPIGHFRDALSCKTSLELAFFVDRNAKWSCHFDDDNYVNVKRLREFLADVNHEEPFYLGKTSTQEPYEMMKPDGSLKKVYFGTAGAGICISRALLTKFSSILEERSFQDISRELGFPDDLTIAFISDVLLDVPLTSVQMFHSHLEDMSKFRQTFRHQLRQQISLSGVYSRFSDNRVHVEDQNLKDPLHFRALHKLLRS